MCSRVCWSPDSWERWEVSQVALFWVSHRADLQTFGLFLHNSWTSSAELQMSDGIRRAATFEWQESLEDSPDLFPIAAYLLPRESSSSPLLTFANVEWFSPDSAITSDLTLIYQFLRSGRTNQKLLPKSAEKNGMWRRSQISRSNLQPSINFIFLLHSCSLQIDCTSIHGTNIHQASDCFDVAFVCMYSNLI